MASKRGASVLVSTHIDLSTSVIFARLLSDDGIPQVTDSRERPPTRGTPQRQNTGVGSTNRPSTRYISVDNVLQYASEIPSGQPRIPPGLATQRRAQVRRSSHGGGGLPMLASTRTGLQNVPSRTTKVSEKLVLLPEAAVDEEAANDQADRPPEAEEENGPLRDEELDVLRKRGGIRGKSYAERLPKPQRAAEKVARLTAYCTAQSYKMKATAEFLRTKHEARTKLYDDCLYAVYQLPLLPGTDGHRLRSRPTLKTPGTGKTVLDLEIERSERRDEHMGYFDDFYSVPGPGGGSPNAVKHISSAAHGGRDDEGEAQRLSGGGHDGAPGSLSPINTLAPEAKNYAEMFVFSYGVVVFWNFTERQEKDALADLTFAESETGVPLVTRPMDESDFETEEFHFEYSPNVKRPRVFNDMITLLPQSDHMVKLTISHAIAQSTKLCYFEEKMSETMLSAENVPKRLALTGELNMTRTEIVKILGRLFKSRVDINLCKLSLFSRPAMAWRY